MTKKSKRSRANRKSKLKKNDNHEQLEMTSYEIGVSDKKEANYSLNVSQSIEQPELSAISDISTGLQFTESIITSLTEENEFYVPADGNCLYISILLGYLLPVISDQKQFDSRLISLVDFDAYNTIAVSENFRQQLMQNIKSIDFLRSPKFKLLIKSFKVKMGVDPELWGGPVEITLLEQRLNISIIVLFKKNDLKSSDGVEAGIYTELESLNKQIRLDKQEKIFILQTNPDTTEVIDSSEDYAMQRARVESASSSKSTQHYRLVYSAPIPFPSLLLGQEEENNFLEPEEEDSSYFRDTENYIYPEGTLRDVVFADVPMQPALTSKEEDEIQQAKKTLKSIIEEFNCRKALYKAMLFSGRKGAGEVSVVMQKTSDGSKYRATPTDIKNFCVSKRDNALEYIHFLAGKASKLMDARDVERAKIEYKAALDYLIQVVGESDVEALKIQLDFAIACCASEKDAELGKNLLEETAEKLNHKLSDSPNDHDLMRALAIARYWLAQYYYSKLDFDEATKQLDYSEHLRRNCSASEKEFDRVRLLRAKIIISAKRNLSEASQLLEECYNFRNTDEFNSNLIPVLDELILIPEMKDKRAKQVYYLTRLLNIKKHHRMDEREIISTQLQLLQAMNLVTSEDEYWEVMHEVESRLNKIPVTQESKSVGLSYLKLAETRLSTLLPQELDPKRKRQYYSKTLMLLAKAESHLSAVGFKAYTSDAATVENLRCIEHLKQDCSEIIDFWDDPPMQFAYQQGKSETKEILNEESNTENEIGHAKKDGASSNASTKSELRALSDFSSEVRHSLSAEEDRLLTIEEFNALPERGKINPNKIRTAQGGINSMFRDGKSLNEAKELLVIDPSYSAKIPPIEVGTYNGKVYSFDTRRLIVHQQAREKNPEVIIHYKKISGQYLQERVEAIFTSRPWNGIVTALRYGGKGSESKPYINPGLRSQLEDTVRKEFHPYPSDRERADPNGFPIIKQKAKKIFSFLSEKDKKGSAFAKEHLKMLKVIKKTRGQGAAYAYLIDLKERLLKNSQISEVDLNEENESTKSRRFTL